MGNSVAKVSIKLNDNHFRNLDDSTGDASIINEDTSNNNNDNCDGIRRALILAGKTVKGKVTIDLGSSELLNQVSDYQLQLQVDGKEKVQVKDGYRVRRAERELLKVKIVLFDFNKAQTDGSFILIPGYHDYPFAFELPPHIPATMSYHGGSSSSCEIRYKIKASLVNINEKRTSTMLKKISKGQVYTSSMNRNDLTDILDFDVRSRPLRPEIVPWSMEPTTREIKSLGVVKKGDISFGARVEDTHISKGDNVQIAVAFRNNSTVEIESFDVALLQTFTITANKKQLKEGGRTRERTEVLKQFQYTNMVEEAAKSPQEVFFAKNILGHDISRIHQEICIELHNNPFHRFSIMVPESTFDSYSGQLIKCSHSLEIKVKTTTMVDDPKFIVPLLILNYCDEEDKTDEPDDHQQQEEADHDDEHDENHTDSARAATDLSELTSIDESPSLDCDEPKPAARRRATIRNPLVRIPQQSFYLGGNRIVELEESYGGFGMESLASLSSSSGNTSTDFDSSGIVLDDGDNDEGDDDEAEAEAKLPCYENLVREMLASLDDLNIIMTRSEDPEWRMIFCSLTAEQFGNLIAYVNLDFDQPKVAVWLASHLCTEASSSSFTCEYVAAAVSNTADWNRITMVQRLLPFCSDLQEKKSLITQVLTPWELTVLVDDFE